MNGERANFLFFKVRQAIGGIEEQAAGLRIERDGDGIDAEVAAAKIFHHAGEAIFGLGARTVIDVLTRGGNGTVHVASKNHFVVAQALAFPHHARAALLHLADHAHGVALDGEIEITDGHAGNQIADGASREIDIHVLYARKLLDALEYGALFGGEPAFQQVHVIGHEFLCLLENPRQPDQARG